MTKAPDHDLRLDARFLERRVVRRPIAPITQLIAGIAALLPAVRDTAQGRSVGRALRAALIIVGLGVLLTGRAHVGWILLGLAIMTLAVPLPLGLLQRRSLVRRIRLAGHTLRTLSTDASLVHDGRRLELHEPDAMIRRVLTDRAFRLDRFRDERDGSLWLRVSPRSSKKKRDAIWLHVEDQPAPADRPPLDPDQPDEHAAHIRHAAALLAQLTAISRTTPLLQELGLADFLTFFDLVKLLGFVQITISDGDEFTHQILLE